jgi:hypothetical protein
MSASTELKSPRNSFQIGRSAKTIGTARTLTSSSAGFASNKQRSTSDGLGITGQPESNNLVLRREKNVFFKKKEE